MGPFEQEFMCVCPKGPDKQWCKILDSYKPEYREFIFEQMLNYYGNVKHTDPGLAVADVETSKMEAIVWFIMVLVFGACIILLAYIK